MAKLAVTPPALANTSGTTIVGNGAVLDGSVAVPLLAWEHFRDETFRFRPRRQAYQQLFRDGLPLVRYAAAAGVLA